MKDDFVGVFRCDCGHVWTATVDFGYIPWMYSAVCSSCGKGNTKTMNENMMMATNEVIPLGPMVVWDERFGVKDCGVCMELEAGGRVCPRARQPVDGCGTWHPPGTMKVTDERKLDDNDGDASGA